MPIPYTFDQVVEAITSTRGENTHYVLVDYLTTYRNDVGVERFKRLLSEAQLRGYDANKVHLAIARLDPGYWTDYVAVFLTQRSPNPQQEMLANLPDVVPREPNAEIAAQLATWLRRRLSRQSYLEFGASWEIPCIVLAVVRLTDISAGRELLASLDADNLSTQDETYVEAALAGDDTTFETVLDDWREQDGTKRSQLTEQEREFYKRKQAEDDAEAASYMRRMGFTTADEA